MSRARNDRSLRCVKCDDPGTLLLGCGHRSCFTCLLANASHCPSCGQPVQNFEGGVERCRFCNSAKQEDLRVLPYCLHKVCVLCIIQCKGKCPLCGTVAPPEYYNVSAPVQDPFLNHQSQAQPSTPGTSSFSPTASSVSFSTQFQSPPQANMYTNTMGMQVTDNTSDCNTNTANNCGMNGSELYMDVSSSNYSPSASAEYSSSSSNMYSEEVCTKQYATNAPFYGNSFQPKEEYQLAQEKEFAHQVVLVTGASQGIGAATAKAFAIRGAKVVLNYNRSSTLADSIVRSIRSFGGEVVAIQADVSQEDSVRELVKTAISAYGRIDVLVNNAGLPGPLAAFHEISSTDWHNMMHTNVDSVYYLTKEVTPHMIKNRYGRIINISSSNLGMNPPLRSAYNASKAAIEAISKTFAKEVGRYGITVNCVAPGTVRTAMLQGSIAKLAHTTGRLMNELVDELQTRSAIGRFIEPEEVANTIVFLASRDSGALNGSVVEVSGGLM